MGLSSAFHTRIFLCLLFISNAALCEPMVLAERGHYGLAQQLWFMAEPQNELQLSDILDDSYQHLWQKNSQREFNVGFSRQAYWLRLQLSNHNTLHRQWTLEIPYPQLDHVDLYLLDEHNGVKEVYYAGDGINMQQRMVKHPNIVFPLTLEPFKSYTLYLRVKSQGSLQVPLSIWQWESFNFSSLTHFLIQGLFYGMILIMALYNLVLWVAEKKAIYLNYVAFISFFTLFELSLHGIGFQYFWPNAAWLNEYLTPLSLALLNASLCYFVSDFFDAQNTSPQLHHTLKISFYGFSILAMAGVFLDYHHAIILIGVCSMGTLGLMIFITLFMLKRKHPSARYFAMAWSVFIGGAVMLLLNKFGFSEITLFSEYGLQMGAGLEVMFLSLAIADRLVKSQRQTIEMQKRSLLLAHQISEEQEKNLSLEKHGKELLEIEVNRRTSELKDTLDKLSLAHERLQTISVTDALTGIFNRYYFNEHWKIEHKRAQRQHTPISLILLDIDYFKRVNDVHGHPAGDMCLQAVAKTIREQAAREMDICCRFGGEEFAIILPATADLGALEVAENIRLAVQALSLDWQGKKIPITVSLGISSLIPHNSKDNTREFMINQADQALYRAKNLGRNRTQIFEPEVI